MFASATCVAHQALWQCAALPGHPQSMDCTGLAGIWCHQSGAHLILTFNKTDLADLGMVTDAQIETVALDIKAHGLADQRKDKRKRVGCLSSPGSIACDRC